MEKAVRRGLVFAICLLAAACASGPAPRPLATGFGAGAGVANPYADGKRHLADGNYELAAQRFGQALAQDGRSLDALNGLAIAYTRLGRFDSAESQFERALQIEPTNAATLNNYGWSLIEQGRLREARAFLELARRHATEAEAPVIAGNIDNLGRRPPPALVAALEEGSGPQAPRGPHRLIRVDDDAYLLETAEPGDPPVRPNTAPDAPLAPSAPEQDAAAAGSSEQGTARPDAPPASDGAAPDVRAEGAAPAAPEHSRAAEPGREVPLRPSGGGPIQLWPQPTSGSGAGPIQAGDKQ